MLVRAGNCPEDARLPSMSALHGEQDQGEAVHCMQREPAFYGAELLHRHACLQSSMAGCGPRLYMSNTSLHACIHLANACSSIYLQSGIMALFERMTFGLYHIYLLFIRCVEDVMLFSASSACVLAAQSVLKPYHTLPYPCRRSMCVHGKYFECMHVIMSEMTGVRSHRVEAPQRVARSGRANRQRGRAPRPAQQLRAGLRQRHVQRREHAREQQPLQLLEAHRDSHRCGRQLDRCDVVGAADLSEVTHKGVRPVPNRQRACGVYTPDPQRPS